MSSKHIRGDMNFAWPTAEIAVMGAEGAVNIIFKDAIAAADDPAAERDAARRGVRGASSPTRTSPRRAATSTTSSSRRETRPRLIRALEMLADKRDTNPRKKHGNIPL